MTHYLFYETTNSIIHNDSLPFLGNEPLPSPPLFDMFITCSSHFITFLQNVHDLFVTCSQHVHNMVTTCSQHGHNMFTTCPFNKRGNPLLPQPPLIPYYGIFFSDRPQNSLPPPPLLLARPLKILFWTSLICSP